MFDAPTPDAAPSPKGSSEADFVRRKAILVRLAAIGMEMAEATKADFDAAETPEERREAMGEFPAVARLVQRAIFLEAKLERDERVEARLVDRVEREMSQEAVLRRKQSVQAVVERLIDVTYDGDNRIWPARQRLQWQLNESFLEPAFADKPLDQVIGILCKSVGIPKPGPIGDNTALWAVNLRKQPIPTPPTEDAADDSDDDVDPDDGLDPLGRRPPITSSA